MTVNRAPNACAYFLRMRTSRRKREREEDRESHTHRQSREQGRELAAQAQILKSPIYGDLFTENMIGD